MIVTGRLTAGLNGVGVELPEECELALREVFEKNEPEAIQIICETLTTGLRLVGVFAWELVDHKVVSANQILARNTDFKPPFDKPVGFVLKRA